MKWYFIKLIAILAMCVASFLFGFSTGQDEAKDSYYKGAVKAGFAERDNKGEIVWGKVIKRYYVD